MIELSCSQLGALFPAFVIVDKHLVVSEAGPSLLRLMPELAPGTHLSDHFGQDALGRHPSLDFWAETGSTIQLESLDSRIVLMGSVLRVGQEYLLALNHAPKVETLSDVALSITDFAHSDPMVGAYMQIGVLKGLLEETKANALDLVRERQRSEELVGRIKSSAGFLAHDFNNLNSIIELNCLNALKAGNLPPDQERRIRVILDSVDRSIEITKALTIVSKQKNDSGLTEDIDEIIRENWPYFRMIAGPRTTLLSDLRLGGIKTSVSRNGLVNCLTSLLMNAREAMAGEAGSVMISSQVDRADGHIVILVADTGPGMDSSVLETAFEPFFSTKEGSYGVGLASVLDFAHEMGGDVSMTSAPGAGTKVRIWMPLPGMLEGPKDLSTSGEASKTSGDGEPAEAVRSILVVEDEPYALEALSELLTDEGYAVTPALSAEEALAALDRVSFSVLLTDVVMPGMDGLALAERACRLQPKLKVVMMSGFMPEFLEMKQDWLFIRKPLDVDVLVASVNVV